MQHTKPTNYIKIMLGFNINSAQWQCVIKRTVNILRIQKLNAKRIMK